MRMETYNLIPSAFKFNCERINSYLLEQNCLTPLIQWDSEKLSWSFGKNSNNENTLKNSDSDVNVINIKEEFLLKVS